MNAASTDISPFALPAPQTDVQAQAQELASRFAGRHREVTVAAKAACSPTSS